MKPNRAPDLDIVIIGSALVELTPQQPGRPVQEVESFVPLPGGSATNFAVALAALGIDMSFISRVGQDELGQWLINQLARRGVNTQLIERVPEHLTPVSFCWVDQSGDKTFYFYRAPQFSDPMSTLTADALNCHEILRGKVLDLTEATIRTQPARDAALRAARIARQAGRTVCYAINYRPNSWHEPPQLIFDIQKQAIAIADVVIMNEQEARLIFGAQDIEQALRQACALGPAVAVATAGEAATLVAFDEQLVEIPSYRVDVQYDVGAGDAFHAGFIAAYLRGLSASQAARWGAAVAALRISRPASAPPPTTAEVEQFIRCAQAVDR